MESRSGYARRTITRRMVIAAGAIGFVKLMSACGTARVAPIAGRDTPAAGQAAGDQQVSTQGAADPFFLYLEVLTADRPSQYGYIAARGCVPSSEFQRRERIVFRFQILDRSTGSLVTDREASLVKLHLAAGEAATGDYKQRGEGSVKDAPWTWDICWDVPPTYPLGSLDYYLEIATKDGKAGTWRPPSLIDPSRGIDSRPRIVPGDSGTT